MKVSIIATVQSLLFCCSLTFAQSPDANPLKWSFSAVRLNEHEARLVFTCNLEDGWHIYSQFLEEGGPLPTTFTFVPDPSYALVGKVNEESTPVKEYDNVFMMPIVWFKNTVIFSQKVQVKAATTRVKGKIEFMGCNSYMCLPPNEIDFSIEVKAPQEGKNTQGK